MAYKRSSIAALVTSATVLVGIAVHEGYRDEAYTPVPGDVPTIGFGTTEGVKPGQKTTPERALIALLKDAEEKKGAIQKCVKVPLYQHELDAYVSLSYNIGSAAFCASTLVKKLNKEDYAGACAEIKRWDKFKGKPLAGLTKRRAEEYRLCVGGLP